MAVALWQEELEVPLALNLPFPFPKCILQNSGAHSEQPVPREPCGLDGALGAAYEA